MRLGSNQICCRTILILSMFMLVDFDIKLFKLKNYCAQ